MNVNYFNQLLLSIVTSYRVLVSVSKLVSVVSVQTLTILCIIVGGIFSS